MSQEKRQPEFRELETVAKRYLDQPTTIPGAPALDGWSQQLRLWHFPAFLAQRVWAVFQRRRPGDHTPDTMVRQITWERPADADRLLNPLQGLRRGFHKDPTVEVRDRLVDTVEFESRRALLHTISVSAFTPAAVGLDGEFFGIELLGGDTVSVEWWCEGPESWRELAAWSAEVRAWLANVASAQPL